MRGSELSGEFVGIGDEVPVEFAPGFNLEALKAVDPNPFFTTVSIKSGKGDQGAGPEYGPEILQNLADQINSKRPPGYRGHQNADNVSWEWREPVTAWVGAKFIPTSETEAELLVKGYVPPTAPELRSQIELAAAGADMVNSVSIFGTREVDKNQNRVTKFDLWSLDWTPKGRAGMETQLVSVSGEQTKEEQAMDRDEVIRSLTVNEVPEHVAGEIRQTERTQVLEENADAIKLAGEMRVILDLGDEADSEAILGAVRTLVDEKQDGELEERVETAVKDKVSAEMVQAAVKDAIVHRLNAKSTDEEIEGEIARALELPYIAALKDGRALPTVQGGGGSDDKKERQGTAWA